MCAGGERTDSALTAYLAPTAVRYLPILHALTNSVVQGFITVLGRTRDPTEELCTAGGAPAR